jgi:signal peptidase II
MINEPLSKKGCCHSANSFISNNRLLWLLIVCLVGISADQASKIWAQRNLAEPYEVSEVIIVDGMEQEIAKKVFYPTRVVEVIPNFFNLIYKENPAAAFSLTSSVPAWFRRPFLITVSVLATIFFLIWYLRMKQKDGLLLVSFSFILAGAIGNLADRLRLGYVIDFLDVHAGPFGYAHLHWPTFNIADSLIVVGAIGVVIRTLWPYKEEEISSI